MIMTKLNAQLPKKTLRVHFNAFNPDLAGQENTVWEVDLDMRMFVESLPAIAINKESVSEINTDSMDEVMEKMASQMRILEEDKAALQQKMAEDKAAMQKMVEDMERQSKE